MQKRGRLTSDASWIERKDQSRSVGSRMPGEIVDRMFRKHDDEVEYVAPFVLIPTLWIHSAC